MLKKYKILVLGSNNVGKNSFIKKVFNQNVEKKYDKNIRNFEFNYKDNFTFIFFVIKINFLNYENYKNIIKNVDVIIFIYDVTRIKTLKCLDNLIKKTILDNNFAIKTLIGNKIDLACCGFNQWNSKNDSIKKITKYKKYLIKSYSSQISIDKFISMSKKSLNVDNMIEEIISLIKKNNIIKSNLNKSYKKNFQTRLFNNFKYNNMDFDVRFILSQI